MFEWCYICKFYNHKTKRCYWWGDKLREDQCGDFEKGK